MLSEGRRKEKTRARGCGYEILGSELLKRRGVIVMKGRREEEEMSLEAMH